MLAADLTHPDRFAELRRVYAAASAHAPALRARFAAAGLAPDNLCDAASLGRLAVLKKEELLRLQQARPPFADMLGCPWHELGHIYVSPGPIFEPSSILDRDGHGMARMFAAAGIGPGDRVLNSWSYHLVPAGLLFDQGLRAVGATVVPVGTGGSELQAELLLTLGITAFLGSTAHFATLIERLEAQGRKLPQDWHLRHAFLGGEFGDWSAKRRALEQRFGIDTWSCYATADFGLIGYEEPGQPGYTVHPGRYVQICDPETGAVLPVGEVGEIVVTTLEQTWPLIRFGTGDAAAALLLASDGGVSRLAPLQGRVGAAVKVREIFVYPSHVEALCRKLADIDRMALVVRRPHHREEITARVALRPGVDPAATEVALRAAFPGITRLKLDHVEFLASAATLDGEPLIADRKDPRA